MKSTTSNQLKTVQAKTVQAKTMKVKTVQVKTVQVKSEVGQKAIVVKKKQCLAIKPVTGSNAKAKLEKKKAVIPFIVNFINIKN